MTDLEQRNKQIVMRFGEAYAGRRLDLLDDVVAPDFVRHCQATPDVDVRSLEQFKTWLRQDWDAVPDAIMAPHLLVAEGDYVAMFASYSGTQTGSWGPLPPSGKHFQLDCGGVFRIAGGRIAEMWVTWDNLAVLAQIGYWPPPGLPVP
jgi:predicted ester cyclase